MERGGTGFQTMIESYKACPDEIKPVVSIYPGFLNLKLFDRLYRDEVIELDLEGLTAVSYTHLDVYKRQI